MRARRAGARTVKHIDLSGKTLLPGLIDMHVHLGPADIGGYRFLEYTDSFWPIAAVGNRAGDARRRASRRCASSARAIGNDVGLKQAIESGYAVGPRIVPAGHALGATGGHCDDTYLPPEPPEEREGRGHRRQRRRS